MCSWDSAGLEAPNLPHLALSIDIPGFICSHIPHTCSAVPTYQDLTLPQTVWIILGKSPEVGFASSLLPVLLLQPLSPGAAPGTQESWLIVSYSTHDTTLSFCTRRLSNTLGQDEKKPPGQSTSSCAKRANSQVQVAGLLPRSLPSLLSLWSQLPPVPWQL